ncbi:uncharacterized protein LOC119072035 [Bradysia coprophila]|uniref:uncharacterized protein LOC119072035 n=1 Tax=Bradysia coprophila TaxID=38358 RepID=UPI00187DD61E|nr:uncharacterized protein LOC119072035 [Bradysia coprophila]
MSAYVRLVLVICMLIDNALSHRKLVTWIRPPKITEWGKWGYPEICPVNSWVGGMRLKVDTSQDMKRDDTALNAVQLHCINMDWIHSGSVTSAIGPWGNFRKNRYCTQGFAVGYQIRSRKDKNTDDVSTVDFKLRCLNFDGSSSFVVNSDVDLPLGSWTNEQKCPLKTAVCGIITQVEPDEGSRFEDETSLTNIDLACCNLPDPVETCKLENKWETVVNCPEAKTRCDVSVTTGFTEDKKESKLAKFYEKLGFVVDFRFAQTTFQLKAKDNSSRLINGKLLENIIGETRISKNTTSLQINCEGLSQQLVLICGSYKIYTKEYRCVPSGNEGSTYRGLYFQPTSLIDNIFWSYNCYWSDFNGALSMEKSLGEECGDLCLSDVNCTHFTWTKDGKCWMKHSAVNLKPIEKYDKGLVCGWIERT